VVDATGYPSTGIVWPPLRQPSLNVTVRPFPVPFGRLTSVTVAATDADNGGAVDGSVSIDGKVVGRTNTAFTYTFVTRRVRTRDPATGEWNIDVIEPVGVVTATGYPAATITFDGV
jgi:hypothetical protein